MVMILSLVTIYAYAWLGSFSDDVYCYCIWTNIQLDILESVIDPAQSREPQRLKKKCLHCNRIRWFVTSDKMIRYVRPEFACLDISSDRKFQFTSTAHDRGQVILNSWTKNPWAKPHIMINLKSWYGMHQIRCEVWLWCSIPWLQHVVKLTKINASLYFMLSGNGWR